MWRENAGERYVPKEQDVKEPAVKDQDVKDQGVTDQGDAMDVDE
jgi:hypothetical protein